MSSYSTSTMWLVVLFITININQHVQTKVGTLQDQILKVQQQIEKKYAELKKSDHHQYLVKVSDETAQFMFNYLDTNQDKFLNRDELINMGKLAVSNDTDTVETFADVTLQADKNDDKLLTFEEFYQPSIQYGEQRDHHDEFHQHKDGHGYHGDPKHDTKYHHSKDEL